MDENRKASGRGWSNAEFRHSTPLQKHTFQETDAPQFEVKQSSPVRTSIQVDRSASQPWTQSSNFTFHSSQETEVPVKDWSSTTIHRQRKEIQLLMVELKDREAELNAMMTSHQRQHQAWERDRQKKLLLEKRCARLDEELQKHNEVISSLRKHVLAVEARETEARRELKEVKQELKELQEKQQNSRDRDRDYEEKKKSLSSTIMTLSTQVGSLQVREEKLSSMLRLKEKDVSDAAVQIQNLSACLREVEAELTKSRLGESELHNDMEESKQRYLEAKQEVTQLRDQLQQQVTQSSAQREEIIRLKQELQLLHRDLALTGGGDSWKDELLQLFRSKQDRVMTELQCLRQVCESQRDDLHLLRLNQEVSQDILRQTGDPSVFGSREEPACNCVDHLSASFQRPVDDPLQVTDSQASGDIRLSRGSFQLLMDESRRVSPSERNNSKRLSFSRRTGPDAEPLHLDGCPTLHRHPNASRVEQMSETPPKASPHRGATHMDGTL